MIIYTIHRLLGLSLVDLLERQVYGSQERIRVLIGATAAPLAPLLLTILSPEELIMRLVKIVF